MWNTVWNLKKKNLGHVCMCVGCHYHPYLRRILLIDCRGSLFWGRERERETERFLSFSHKRVIDSFSLFLSCATPDFPSSFCLSTEDIDQHKKLDSDSGVGSDNGDKRLSATEVSLYVCVPVWEEEKSVTILSMFFACLHVYFHIYSSVFSSFLQIWGNNIIKSMC